MKFCYQLLASLFILVELVEMQTGQWKLTWSDEFNGPANSSPDPTKWNYDIGGWGWGNQELEYYTNRTANVAQNGAGQLNIVARNDDAAQYSCWYGQCKYTSARIKTQNLFTQQYGRFEASIKVPSGGGLWPAFWLLGADIVNVSWPACGEIDIMEVRGSKPSTVLGTIHGPNYNGGGGIGSSFSLANSQSFSSGFHTFSVDWNAQNISWAVDGNTYNTVTKASLSRGSPWVFDHDFFILLNFAVGGQFDGSPRSGVTFPQTLSIDYVRVYQKTNP